MGKQPERLKQGPVLRLENFVCERAYRRLFAPINLSLGAGQILWFRGHNGAGKTTLLRGLIGLFKPVGRAWWLGRQLGVSDAHYVGHELALHADFSVRNQVLWWCAANNKFCSEPMLRIWLKEASLIRQSYQLTSALSAGQRQRLALLLCQISEKSLWILDEPLTHLDDQSVVWWSGVCEAHLEAGGCLVVTTHVDWPWLQTYSSCLEFHLRERA